MTLSELIAEAQALQAKHGDIQFIGWKCGHPAEPRLVVKDAAEHFMGEDWEKRLVCEVEGGAWLGEKGGAQ